MYSGITLEPTKTRNLTLKNEGNDLHFKFPKGHIPFGFSEKSFNEHAPPTVNLEIEVTDTDTISQLCMLESAVVDKVIAMKSNVTPDDFNSNFRNGRFRVKFHHTTTHLYDSDSKPITDVVVDGSYRGWKAACKARASGVYFMNKKFGIIWSAEQIKLFDEKGGLTGYAFMDD